ncbi:MAG: MBL fold metallo-hydrolase [Acidobacteriota bacterium]|nr:MBL fold metallo-hydrolase [Blastocatellia bacterium]MDW8413280.1 MBL fold metallo-hydrolase [Acidobacteriota bacterium]
MYFKQFYLGCLAHASYLIGSDGEAAVVDPQRDIEQYIQEAEALGLKIRYVIETHLHADFVSGHRELAERTGAQIVFGARAGAEFEHYAAKDGDVLKLGKISLRILETPGHTPEGICIVVEEDGKPMKVLTGDTLFIGDVGRPDLVAARGYTPQQMAGMLYDSLHEKLLKLPDEVEVYPAHGAGSLCGRSLSKETSSTIGEQKRLNYALRVADREEFIRMMTTDLPEVPAYFPKDAEINRTGAVPLDQIKRPEALTPAQVKTCGALILDVRSAAAFGAGHVPGAMNIGLSGQFASWAGTLIPIGKPIVIVAENEAGVDEAMIRLARVGHESVIGYLDGGMYAWNQAGFAVATIEQITVADLKDKLTEGIQLIDVRRPAEYAKGRVPTAINIPLADLQKRIGEIDRGRPTAVICQSGYRSSAATSILAASSDFVQLYNVTGGTSAWMAAGYEVTESAACVS